MITLTGVEVSPDFSHARSSSPCSACRAHVADAVEGLKRAAGFLRSRARASASSSTPLRSCTSMLRRSVERGDRLSRLIDAAVDRQAEPASGAAPTEPRRARRRRRPAARQAGRPHSNARAAHAKRAARRRRPATPGRSIRWPPVSCRSASARRPSSRGRCSTRDKELRRDDRFGARPTTGRPRGRGVGARPCRPTDERIAKCWRASRRDRAGAAHAFARSSARRPLYELAREGETVERDARRITIHALELIELGRRHVELRVDCSKGTYVRTLAEDIGRRWERRASRGLRRTRVGISRSRRR